MNTDHACGGRFRRTDIKSKWDPRRKMWVYFDTDPLKANWRCDVCGAVRFQRKRQKATKEGVGNGN